MKDTTTVFSIAFIILQYFFAPVQAATLLIRNVSLIDSTGSPVQKNMNVLLDAARIVRITTANASVPAGAKVIDGSGLFLIPGLWDMHVHWYEESYLPLFVANGVTGVRQMWGMDMHYAWRSRENDPSYIGPKQVIASAILDGAPKVWPTSIEVTSAEFAREQVRLFHAKGADFIKVYDRLNRDVYFAIADESKKVGIPFAGHVPQLVSLAEASDAGQKSMEHMVAFDTGLVTDPAAFEAKYSGELKPETMLARREDAIRSEDGAQKNLLFKKFADNATWQSPTLALLRNRAFLRERLEVDKHRLTYIPKQTTSSWLPPRNLDFQNITDERQWKARQVRFAYLQRLVGEMHKAGVRVIAGTDVRNPFCFPGFSLHDELELLVEAGLSPMAALQAATSNAAEYSGKSNVLGTVTEGKIADLVLLSENPLDDIRNTTKITAVILNGVYHDRSALDAMLKRMQEQANYGK